MDYYLLTDPRGIEGWVGHVGWLIVDSVTIKWSPIKLAVWRRIGKVRRPRPAFDPLCYVSTNPPSTPAYPIHSRSSKFTANNNLNVFSLHNEEDTSREMTERKYLDVWTDNQVQWRPIQTCCDMPWLQCSFPVNKIHDNFSNYRSNV